jgi:ZIP family zinc transporter
VQDVLAQMDRVIFISPDELLPTAREYGEHHFATYGLVAGMAVMALSLLMFLHLLTKLR